KKSLAPNFLIVAGSSHVADHSDDRPPRGLRVRIAVGYPLSNRVLAGPELIRKRLVDQKHLLPVASILLAQLPPAKKRDSHRFKITRRHKVDRRLHALRCGKRRSAFDREV